MVKKKMQKHKIKQRREKNLFLKPLALLFGVLALLLWAHTSPFLNAPEEIDETRLMTSLPPKMQNVLGTTSSSKQFRVPILMYHYIEYVADPGDKIRISLNVIPSVFESQLKTLKDAGYTFLTASDLDKILAGKGKLPAKPILLTFDDGYRDFYTDAYPILKKYNTKATQYVIAGFLDRPNHLLTSQLQEIVNDKLVEIGAHTMNHLWLKGLSEQKVKYEITESRKQLQDLTHDPINSFAYPYGAFDEQAVEIAKEAGFSDALSTLPGVSQSKDNKYFLYRLRPGWRTGSELIAYLDSNFPPTPTPSQ